MSRIGDYSVIMYSSKPNDSTNRFHSVSFGGTSGDFTEVRNTYSTWHLVPDSVPIVELPEQKKQTVDIPGSNGVLDLSMSLTKFPLFNRRSGSMTFIFVPWFGDKTSQEVRDDLFYYLHGKKRRMVLEDDPDYYYIGYFSVKWTNNSDSSPSTVEISYDLEPYKYSVDLTYLVGSSSSYKQIDGSVYKFGELITSTDSALNSIVYDRYSSAGSSTNRAYTVKRISFSETSPTSLVVEVNQLASQSILDIGFRNTYLGIDELTIKILEGSRSPRYSINSTGTYTITKYPVCGLSGTNTIVIDYDLESFSPNGSSKTAALRIGYRKAKI